MLQWALVVAVQAAAAVVSTAAARATTPPSVGNQWPHGPTPEPYAAAAPLGPAARSRVRGADSLAQALDLLANPHRIVDDRRLGDQTRVV